MLQLLTNAPDEEPIVSVANGHNQPYDYVVGALNIIPRMEDLRRFGINPSQALKAMRLNPDYRAKMVREIVEIVSDPYLGKGYNSERDPQLFMTTPYSTNIRVGGGKVVIYNEKALLSQLKQYGLYKVADRFRDGNPIRIGILDTLRTPKDGFMGEVEGL
ncbi:MAG: hypothetical protein CL610_15975 [Anaerolineaceae bacterium]|nr:hypothetical protein [Anaerolineaceae bacterium]